MSLKHTIRQLKEHRPEWPTMNSKFINSVGYYKGIAACFFGALSLAGGLHPKLVQEVKEVLPAKEFPIAGVRTPIEPIVAFPTFEPKVRSLASVAIQEQLEELQRDFNQIQDLEIVQNNDGPQVEFVVGHVFRAGSAEMGPRATKEMNKLAEFLRENFKERELSIEAYTDPSTIKVNRESFPSNWELSSARAAHFLRILEEKGFEPRQLRAVGYGSRSPEGRKPASSDRKRWSLEARRIIVVIN